MRWKSDKGQNRGSYSLLKYSNNGDAVSKIYCSNDDLIIIALAFFCVQEQHAGTSVTIECVSHYSGYIEILKASLILLAFLATTSLWFSNPNETLAKFIQPCHSSELCQAVSLWLTHKISLDVLWQYVAGHCWDISLSLVAKHYTVLIY